MAAPPAALTSAALHSPGQPVSGPATSRPERHQTRPLHHVQPVSSRLRKNSSTRTIRTSLTTATTRREAPGVSVSSGRLAGVAGPESGTVALGAVCVGGEVNPLRDAQSVRSRDICATNLAHLGLRGTIAGVVDQRLEG